MIEVSFGYFITRVPFYIYIVVGNCDLYSFLYMPIVLLQRNVLMNGFYSLYRNLFANLFLSSYLTIFANFNIGGLNFSPYIRIYEFMNFANIFTIAPI